MTESWDYVQHGDDWKRAGTGKLQSPIDIPRNALLAQTNCSNNSSLPSPIEFRYYPVPLRSCNFFQAASRPTKCCTAASSMSGVSFGSAVLDGKEFEVAEFHFHSPAEHLFDGERYPLELHIVHKFKKVIDGFGNADSRNHIVDDYSVRFEDEILVLGVVLRSASEVLEETPMFSLFRNITESLDSSLISQGNNDKADNANNKTLNLADIFTNFKAESEKNKIFRYFGSLTTPPCSEVVHWCLMPSPCDIPARFVKILASSMKNNMSTCGTYRNIIQKGCEAEQLSAPEQKSIPLKYYGGDYSEFKLKDSSTLLTRPVYMCPSYTA